MFEFTKDDQIRRLERRMEALERRLNKNLKHLDNSFRLFIDVLEKMEKENKRLINERDQLIDDYNKLIKKIYIPDKRETKPLLEPVKKKIKDEMDFVRLIAKETISETPSDKLYELIILNGKINSTEAARKLNVRESRIHNWAKTLEQKGLIEIQKDGDKLNLVKI